jgi:hypothetical protein
MASFRLIIPAAVTAVALLASAVPAAAYAVY